ncbi:Clathrin interactor EPSIN like [Quillaja saponaria]|uniref:Clathrin interactor EPSIN like n=1 Tax=Quillaja saponaria TaxID=32244 RepID=A0AAD7VKP8_QUISA|nr:Clathrin interactor EPSIN like [Quillaja saponaria]
MKKAIGQTVRDLKREVNKKVLKVPGIEQKVLDATSNEPWGPHGSLLADIAHATRNYHEYQMIMAVIWKRINDTGKNWRHVYKALTVLEYLVGHGSERVIDEIKEHAYQISTLSDFQYIDSSGRDQGSNVRKKSQSLVVLVNDKERIVEVRQKAAANRDKFRNTSAGGMYRPGSYSSSGVYGDRYDDDRYGSRDEDRNGYGRERDRGYRDDDQYGRNEDSYSRDGDRYGRDYEDRYSKDGSRDDDYRGRSRSVDDYRYGSRSRSSDRGRDNDEDGQYSSRGVKADDHPQNGRGLERKFSEQNIGAPPSYEEAVSESQSPVHIERDGKTSATSVPRVSSPPPASSSPGQANTAIAGNGMTSNPDQATTASGGNATANKQAEAFDEFDPRGAVSAPPATSNNVEMDLLGSLSESFSSNALAIVPTTSTTTSSDADANTNSGFATTFTAASSASNNTNQHFEDPFGDSPFKAISSTEIAPSQPQTSTSTGIFQPTNQIDVPPQTGAPNTVSNFMFGDTLSGLTYSPSDVSSSQPQEDSDILADILPPAPLPTMTAQPTFTAATGQPAPTSFSPSAVQPAPTSFAASTGPPALPSFSVPTGHPSQQPFSVASSQPAQQAFSAPTSQPTQQAFAAATSQPSHPTFFIHSGQPVQSSGNMYSGFHPQPPQSQAGHFSSENFLPQGSMVPVSSHMAPQTSTGPSAQSNYFPQQGGSQFNTGNFLPQQGPATPVSSHNTLQNTGGPGGKQNSDVLSNLLGQSGANATNASRHVNSSSTGSLAIVPQPSKDKFETKSTVWTDTLSRGLVNLNISGSKTNPLADIGIDFEAINRKEKRMEKPSANPVTSTVTMGKAMGSGSGIGRAGAGAIRPPPNPVMGSGMGMGMAMAMGGGTGTGMGMGGYGGMNPSMGMGMGGYRGMNPSMGMNMGMGQGAPMQPPTGLPPGSNMSGNYMMGSGGYAPQQPYGGGYQ